MFFSVIVPVHNVEKYVGSCIKSIVEQSFNDFEVILVINASTDGSLKICEDWAKKDLRVKLIVTEKPGVSNARNLGLEIAQGEWIIFVDADDYLLNNSFETFKENIADGIDMVVANYTQSIPSYKLNNTVNIVDARAYMLALLDSPMFFSKMNSGLQWNPVVLDVNWAKAYRRSVIEHYKLRFNKDIAISEDLIFNMDYLETINKISCINALVYYYRVTEDSASRECSSKRINQRIDYINYLLDKRWVNVDLQEANKYQITQNILRTIVVASKNWKQGKVARKKIKMYLCKDDVQSVLHSVRTNRLSMGKFQNYVYMLMLLLIKKERLTLMFIIAFVYGNSKRRG